MAPFRWPHCLLIIFYKNAEKDVVVIINVTHCPKNIKKYFKNDVK